VKGDGGGTAGEGSEERKERKKLEGENTATTHALTCFAVFQIKS